MLPAGLAFETTHFETTKPPEHLAAVLHKEKSEKLIGTANISCTANATLRVRECLDNVVGMERENMKLKCEILPIYYPFTGLR